MAEEERDIETRNKWKKGEITGTEERDEQESKDTKKQQGEGNEKAVKENRNRDNNKWREGVKR